MTRITPALAALCLLACSPAAPGDAPADGADAPRSEPARAAPAHRARRAPGPAATPSQRADTGGAYQYVDETGHVQLAARLEDVPERQRSTAGHISVAATAPVRTAKPLEVDEARARTTDAPVVIYTTRTCPYCRAAMAYMDRIGQDYENKDVQADEDARDEYLRVTGGNPGVPVIVVGEGWMQGWSQQHFDRLVAQASAGR